jgi:hypothetical protein
LATSDQAPAPEGVDTKLPDRLKAPKGSSASLRELASTIPRKRLTIPGRQPSSEELDVELRLRVGAPKSTSASQHGLASTSPGDA